MDSRERKIILIIALIVAAAVITSRVHIYVSGIHHGGKHGSQPRRIRFRCAGRHRQRRYNQRAYGEEPRRSA